MEKHSFLVFLIWIFLLVFCLFWCEIWAIDEEPIGANGAK
jgi:hypothetical protein